MVGGWEWEKELYKDSWDFHKLEGQGRFLACHFVLVEFHLDECVVEERC